MSIKVVLTMVAVVACMSACSTAAAAPAGRKLLGDPIAPQQPTVSDIDLYTKYNEMAAKLEQEKAKRPDAQQQPTPPMQGARRHLLDVIPPQNPTVYDTSSHQSDVMQEFAQRAQQETAQQPTQSGDASP